jgi:hypothetical protein
MHWFLYKNGYLISLTAYISVRSFESLESNEHVGTPHKAI